MAALFKRFEVRVSAGYLIAAMLWIILSDTLVARLSDGDSVLLISANTWKGMGFVAVTTLVLFIIVAREVYKRTQIEQALLDDMQEHKQAEAAEREQGRFAEALRDSLFALTASLDVDQVMQQILDSAAAVVPCEAGSIVLFENNEGRIAYTRGFPPESLAFVQDYRFPNQYAQSASAFGDSKPYLVFDTKSDPNWFALPFTAWIRSTIGVPIEIREKVIGVLISDSAEPHHFHQSDVEKLTAFARYAALALENAYHVTRLEQNVLERTAELQSAKIRVEAILNNSLDGILLTYTDLHIQQTNAAFNTLLACDYDDYFDTSLLDLIHMDDVGPVSATLEKVLSERAGKQTETRIRRKNGSVFDAELSIGYVRDMHNEMDSLVCAIRDITERKQADVALRDSESRLRESQQMLQNILETIPVGVFWKDRNSVYIGCNRVVVRDSGATSSAEIIGKSDAEMPWHQRAEFYRNSDLEVLERGAPIVEYEQPVSSSDGAIRWFYNIKVPLRSITGEIIGLLGTYTDITERKHSEEALRLAFEREKELGELKSRFVSMASHELRTPLTSILSSAEILTRYRAKMDDEQIQEKLDLIARQVRHLGNIIEDVLDLGRMQSGRIDFNPAMTDLDLLCQDIIAEFRGQPVTTHEVLYHCDQKPVMVNLDHKLIRQVITNLLSNAIKYSPASQRVWIVLELRDQSAVLCVRDTGIGIPAADIKHLFEPFHRARNVGAISGTGLGLAISKEAVERHDGTISVESEVGVGTTFCVHLPLGLATDLST